MRILEYNDFRSGSFPQKEDIQACFYDITEDENICPPNIFKGKHAEIIFLCGNLYKKTKLIDYKDRLIDGNNKYYHGRLIWDFINDKFKRSDNTKNLNETNEFDYLIFCIRVKFKQLEYEPTFNRFKNILGSKDRFNQEYGKGEDVYTKAQKNFKEYDDEKNKELFDIIDILEGCIGRVQDIDPKWTPFNYLVGSKRDKEENELSDIHYQGYYVFDAPKEELTLWDRVFRSSIESNQKKIIDGILE